MARPPLSSIHSPSSARRGAFTLIELLVVLSLIVLALAAAVPAFSYITGSRSTDSAQNMIGAMLQRARSQAIQSRRVTGVAFFLNPRDQRATMALVTKSTVSSGLAEDPYPNYRGWTNQSFQQNTGAGTGLVLAPPNGPPYADGQEVVALYLRDNKASGSTFDPAEEYRHATRPFSRDTSPENNVNNNNNPSPMTTLSGSKENSPSPWTASDGGSNGTVQLNIVDFLSDSGLETLPAGLGVQTINDPKGFARERYLQTGVILFDPDGRTVSVPYAFQKDSQLYNLLIKPNLSVAARPALLPTSAKTDFSDVYYSQLGVVIYDRATFLNQPGNTEGDPAYQDPTYTDVLRIPGPSTAGPESKEETWLDENTTPLFVNRGNGVLLKGQ